MKIVKQSLVMKKNTEKWKKILEWWESQRSDAEKDELKEEDKRNKINKIMRENDRAWAYKNVCN